MLCAVTLLAGCGAEEVSAPQAAVASSYDDYDALYQDWAPRYVDCVRAAGGSARIQPHDNSILDPVVPGRSQIEGLDAQCVAKVGPAPEGPPVSESFLVGMYELYQRQAECLRGAGYQVPEAPSRQVWVETYGADSWFPLVEILRSGVGAEEADHLCPQPSPNEAEKLGRELTGK